MKVAFVNSSFQEDTSQNTRNIMMAEALYANNEESIFYTPVRKKGIVTIRLEGKNQVVSIFISCWVPFFSTYRRTLENESITFRRILDLMEYFMYLTRILTRLHRDRVDAFVILHLWDSTISLLNPILSRFRPVAILWMGHSLRWYAEFGPLYHLLVPFYKLVLRKTIILTPIDAEQEICLLKILKLPRKNVFRFNPCIVDEKMFHEMDKEECAKIAGFDTKHVNILTMLVIRDPEEIKKLKSIDYQKDVFRVLEIFRFLVKINPDAHLHIVGHGPGFEKLKTTISNYGLQREVSFHGFIEDEVRPIFVNAADLVINPYPLIEFNDATAIFEAFLCGKPVVAFKRYSWVPTEHTGGFLIDIDPKIGAQQFLLRLDPAYLAKKSKEAKTIPYEHYVPMMAWGKRLLKILVEMLKDKQCR
jgi:glycosyltransferase involved in cell wall biosynthesis